ncbi:hypothetical protein [Pseudofrankia asymbiotica]|uniref:Uncharacterized protein n=1 Tax=Pseudofrankia asymbiotica TaxID=1834516 RepID=A0A1V2IG47_9ACTN|nr:hypothetical protein [Pseudofrankia asymbiotica]ONH32134.1 hypothetical protein BL253_06505 [Pseudofrankia asymbiotica]
MRLWRRDGRHPTAATSPAGGVDLEELDDREELGGLDEPEEAAAGPGGASGPVMLTLTTREQIEKTAVAEAAPKVVRVRPGRGAFGGVASGGGCGPGCSH